VSAARFLGGVAGAIGMFASVAAETQTGPGRDEIRVAPLEYVGGQQPVMDRSILAHVLMEQLEDCWNGRNHQFRYDGQAWVARTTTSSG
jgi:copper resistance protein B